MPCELEHYSQYLPEGHQGWSISLTDGILKTVPQQPHQHQLLCIGVDFVGWQIPISKKMGTKKSSTICWLKELTFSPLTKAKSSSCDTCLTFIAATTTCPWVTTLRKSSAAKTMALTNLVTCDRPSKSHNWNREPLSILEPGLYSLPHMHWRNNQGPDKCFWQFPQYKFSWSLIIFAHCKHTYSRHCLACQSATTGTSLFSCSTGRGRYLLHRREPLPLSTVSWSPPWTWKKTDTPPGQCWRQTWAQGQRVQGVNNVNHLPCYILIPMDDLRGIYNYTYKENVNDFNKVFPYTLCKLWDVTHQNRLSAHFVLLFVLHMPYDIWIILMLLKVRDASHKNDL